MQLIKHKDKVRLKKIHTNEGRVAGVTIEHGDGRIDGVARPETIRGRTRRV